MACFSTESEVSKARESHMYARSRYLSRVLQARSPGSTIALNAATEAPIDETTPGGKASAAIACRQRPSAASRAVQAPSSKNHASRSQPRRAARSRSGANEDNVGTVVRVFQRTSPIAPAPRLNTTVLRDAAVR